MEFFSGFSWAVPTAFADAVALCRFEQGDTLYDTPKAYEENWSEATKHINHWLQVRDPSSPKTDAGDSTGSIFAKNWDSEIRVDLYKNLKKVGEGQTQTTQGRLYTALWTGNVDVLQMEYDEPKAPLNVQEVTKKLEDTENKAGEFSKGFPVFVMARDPSNKISQAKYSKIFSKLRNHMSDDPLMLNPRLAGIKEWNAFAPTIEIAFFPLIDLTQEEVEALVKEAVYLPTKNAKKEMFKIAGPRDNFLMDIIKFLVKGSAPEPYQVTFTKTEKNLNAFCTCPAGENGQYCKHRFDILSGSTNALVSENQDEVEIIRAWLPGSYIEEALKEMAQAEHESNLAGKRLSLAKKKVAKAMRS